VDRGTRPNSKPDPAGTSTGAFRPAPRRATAVTRPSRRRGPVFTSSMSW
jgi:hypothetical protein